ncbi:hypothetical protein AB1L05_20570 [Cytobacillus horneckiae]|uniref:YczE/YyaS/YitT family protein n=1 Tax=Cytobacillus horneckiae TaxID=549687 RepID=UPI0039A1A396
MFKRIILYFLGISCVGLGINILILANVGLDPWGIFNISLSNSLGIRLGEFYIYSGILFVAINSLIQRKFPDILGMITSFFMGVSIDLFAIVLNNLSLYSRWIEFSIGLVLFCLGVAFYLSTSLPRSPVDDLIFSTQRLINKSFKVSKIVLDSLVLLLGLILGGKLGAGTLIMVILVGPLITLFTRILEKINEKNNLLRFR